MAGDNLGRGIKQKSREQKRDAAEEEASGEQENNP